MDLGARKINRASWGAAYAYANEPGARVFKKDLYVDEGDALSLWACTDTDDDIAEAALAVASNFSEADTFDLILLSLDDLDHEGFCVTYTDGVTPIADLRGRHVDIRDLTIGALYHIAMTYVFPNIPCRSKCKRFRKGEVLRLLTNAVQQGRLNIEQLGHTQKRLREQLGGSSNS